MRQRAEPIAVQERDPWACITYATAPDIWLRRPGVQECSRLSSWLAALAEERGEHVEALRVQEGGGDLATVRATVAQVVEIDAAIVGAALGMLWAHPTLELEARTLRDLGAYSGLRQAGAAGVDPTSLLPTRDVDGCPITRHPDPRRAFAVDAHEELIGAGWSHGQLSAAATHAILWLRAPLGSMGRDVDHGEWRDFSAAQTAPSDSRSST